ncbi:MAG: protein phosphatase CheZ, partial [Gammaproteobacteria bacterium]
RELSAGDFRVLYNEVGEYLGLVNSSSSDIHKKLQEILLAQNYQDLTGQSIKKVIEIVTDFERKLLKLMVITAEAGKITEQHVVDLSSVEKLMAGQVKTEQTATQAISLGLSKQDESSNKIDSGPGSLSTADKVSGQDEVDDLLSSLGF